MGLTPPFYPPAFCSKELLAYDTHSPAALHCFRAQHELFCLMFRSVTARSGWRSKLVLFLCVLLYRISVIRTHNKKQSSGFQPQQAQFHSLPSADFSFHHTSSGRFNPMCFTGHCSILKNHFILKPIDAGHYTVIKPCLFQWIQAFWRKMK